MGYSPSLGNAMRRIVQRISRPPTTPMTSPTLICSANSPATWPNAPALRPPAVTRLAISAMPTGSFAPDSPSRIVPAGSPPSRFPRTENTTAGSVGATAVPTSSATYHSNPKRKCAATAAAATVRNVPSTPASTTVDRAPRRRLSPMCMPPSNRMIARAIVTIRSTVRCGGASRPGMTAAATAAPATNSAGAGSWMRSLSRLDNTASSPTAAMTATRAPNGPTSCTQELPYGLSANPVADQASRHTDVEVRPSTMRQVHWSERLPVDPDVDTDHAADVRWVALAVFAGGCVGGLMRYSVVKAWPEPHAGFPWSTFAVNVAGALLLGVIVVVATEVATSWRYLRPLLGAGFC